MAVLAGAALLSVPEPIWEGQGEVLVRALWAVSLGAAATVAKRGWRMVRLLTQRG
jgi:hypothetical protein